MGKLWWLIEDFLCNIQACPGVFQNWGLKTVPIYGQIPWQHHDFCMTCVDGHSSWGRFSESVKSRRMDVVLKMVPKSLGTWYCYPQANQHRPWKSRIFEGKLIFQTLSARLEFTEGNPADGSAAQHPRCQAFVSFATPRVLVVIIQAALITRQVQPYIFFLWKPMVSVNMFSNYFI